MTIHPQLPDILTPIAFPLAILEAVAEGVEHVAQREFLDRLTCSEIQGTCSAPRSRNNPIPLKPAPAGRLWRSL